MIDHSDIERMVREAVDDWNRKGKGRMTPETVLIASYWMGRGLREGYRLGRHEGHEQRVEMLLDALCIRPEARVLGDYSDPKLTLVTPTLTEPFPEDIHQDVLDRPINVHG